MRAGLGVRDGTPSPHAGRAAPPLLSPGAPEPQIPLRREGGGPQPDTGAGGIGACPYPHPFAGAVGTPQPGPAPSPWYVAPSPWYVAPSIHPQRPQPLPSLGRETE